MKRLFFLFVFIGLGIPPSFLAICCGDNQHLQERIEIIRNKYESIGMSVVVVKNHEIVYSHSFGYNPNYNDPTKKDSISQDDIYYIASVSKTFVGTAIMQLAEKGKISLDDDVNLYLSFPLRNPAFPSVPITIRMLLSHSSSIKKGVAYNNFDKIVSNKQKDINTLFNNCMPGTMTDYSNLGYTILGAVIEKASGQRFDDYIEENIIKPLGLYGGFNPKNLDSTRFVRSYRYTGGKFVKQSSAYIHDLRLSNYRMGHETPALRPAGGMIISAYDLAKYMIMHMNKGVGANGKRIISEDSEMLLRDKSIHNLYYTTKYVPGIQLIGMNGGARGMHTEMFFSPDKGFGFVILCNGCNSTGAADGGLNKLVMQELYKTFIAE